MCTKIISNTNLITALTPLFFSTTPPLLPQCFGDFTRLTGSVFIYSWLSSLFSTVSMTRLSWAVQYCRMKLSRISAMSKSLVHLWSLTIWGWLLQQIWALKYLNPLVTNALSHPYHLDESTFTFRGIRSISFYFSMNFLCANRKGPDGMPCFAASHLGLFCLPMSHVHVQDTWLIWVKVSKFSNTHLLYLKHLNIQTYRFYHSVIPSKDANGKTNSEDPDQTVLLAAV